MRFIISDREIELADIITPWMHYDPEQHLVLLDDEAPEDIVAAYNEFKAIKAEQNELRKRMYGKP